MSQFRVRREVSKQKKGDKGKIIRTGKLTRYTSSLYWPTNKTTTISINRLSSPSSG